MKTKSKREFIAPVAGHWRVIAAFLAIALSASAMSRAQSSPAQTPPAATADNPAPQALPAAPAGAAATGERQPRGGDDAIRVHGHWMIEVRNPDGELVSHREFENGLSGSAYGGAILLSALLGRVVTPGSWMVQLQDVAGGQNNILIAEANSTASRVCTAFQNGSDLDSCSATPLTIAGPTLSNTHNLAGASTLTLEGSGIVPKNFPGMIGVVATYNLACEPPSSATACFDASGYISSDAYGSPFTYRQLNGAAGTPTAPVAVSPGQTVSVKVVISFASGT